MCTSKMNLSDEVDLEDYVSRPDKISAAEIHAICQEAGLHAVRKNRWVCKMLVIHRTVDDQLQNIQSIKSHP